MAQAATGLIFFGLKNDRPSCIDYGAKEGNSIRLHPPAVNLPLHTGLKDLLQNKFSKANEDVCRELLKLFAKYQYCKEVVLLDGQSMADLAREQLKPSVMDLYSRFGIYVFPQVVEIQIKLLGQTLIFVFTYDGQSFLLWKRNYLRSMILPKMCGRTHHHNRFLVGGSYKYRCSPPKKPPLPAPGIVGAAS